MYAEIVFPIPLNKKFHYSVPSELTSRLQVGMRVLAQFGTRLQTGYCIGLVTHSPIAEEKVKPIEAVIDNEPMFDEKMLTLTRWMAEYYFCSWGQALEAVVPSGVRKQMTGQHELMVTLAMPREKIQAEIKSATKLPPQQARVLKFLLDSDISVPLRDSPDVHRGLPTLSYQEVLNRLKISPAPVDALRRKKLLKVFRRTLDYDPFLDTSIPHTSPFTPTPEQAHALEIIKQSLDRNEFKAVLLHGITGSGKTEVYLQAIEYLLSQGRQAIILVPEIALTPQTIFRFRSRFDSNQIAILHSYLSEGPRAQQWHKIRDGTAKIVIGARSAVFAPTTKLGLIVIDEEHEPSFKQENVPMYHARDIAQMRARQENAVLILGSATPSLESFYKASAGEYTRIELPYRIEQRPLPPVEIIDLTHEISPKNSHPVLSKKMELAISEELAQGNQIILFLNRRGFATLIICPRCGAIIRCPRCQVAFTYHKELNQVLCHYCNETHPPPTVCPECGHPQLKYRGTGTEKVEELIKRLFKEYQIARMDSDIMTTYRAYKKTLSALDTGKVNILIGTQMVAKGLDFPNVTLVGIISSDTALYLTGDFRSAERTFQLVTHVAGRTGRGPKGGRVLLQTFKPNHYSIRYGSTHDYLAFAREELKHRQELNYPPFSQLLRILVEGRDIEKVKTAITKISDRLTKQITRLPVELLGPAPAPLAKIKGKHRWHLLIKSKDIASLQALLYNETTADSLKQLTKEFVSSSRAIKISLDMEPVSLL
jgi:primosomal protein N' (replication factor Y)